MSKSETQAVTPQPSLDFITEHLPNLADQLARHITDHAIPLLRRCGLSLDDMSLTAALEFRRVNGEDNIRVALSVRRPDPDEQS